MRSRILMIPPFVYFVPFRGYSGSGFTLKG